MEIYGLRAKLASTENVPIIFLGNEEDFYQGEIKDIILDILAEQLNKLEDNTRKADATKGGGVVFSKK